MLTLRSIAAFTAIAITFGGLDATTIIIKEIKNESNASLTIRFPNLQQRKVPRHETLSEAITIVDSSSADLLETPPVVFAEGKLRLFDIQFVRERKTHASGRTEVTLKVIQDGKKVIAQQQQGYLFDRDVYTVDITVKPGKGQVIAYPSATIKASYGQPGTIETDWQEL